MKNELYEIVANHCDQDCIDKKCVYCEANVDQILDLILNSIVIEKKESRPYKTETDNYISYELEMSEKDGFNECVQELELLKEKLRQ